MNGAASLVKTMLASGVDVCFANPGTSMLNIVGDHASYHLRYDSPLKGDVKGISETISQWTRVSGDAASVAWDGAEAIRAARSKNGQITSLILPANTAWEDADGAAVAAIPAIPHRPRQDEVDAVAKKLCQPGAAIVLGGRALHAPFRAKRRGS